MSESPEQMTRRVLRDRYPRPQTPTLTAALMIAATLAPSLPTEPRRLCGCWGGHHDGCKMPR